MKRGQATLFIILGMLIVAAAGAAIYFRGDIIKERIMGITEVTTYPEDIQLLRDEVEACHTATAQEAVELLGLQGGYIFPPESRILQAGEDLVTYAYDKRPQTPSTNTMEQELQDYIDIMLPLCPEYDLHENLNIQAGDPQVKASIKDDRVEFETIYILTANSGEDSYRISEPYTSTINARLGIVQQAAEGIVERVEAQPDKIDPEYLLTLGIPITAVPYDEDIVIYFIEDDQSEFPIGGEIFTYIFATRK